MVTIFGVAALGFMMLMYALERRGRSFILAFACGCLLSSAYGFLAGTWPFGVSRRCRAALPGAQCELSDDPLERVRESRCGSRFGFRDNSLVLGSAQSVRTG
jgi:hypothetical protein